MPDTLQREYTRSGLTCRDVFEEGTKVENYAECHRPFPPPVSAFGRREIGHCHCPRRVFVRQTADGAMFYGGCDRKDCGPCREYRRLRMLGRIKKQVAADMGTGVLYLMGGINRRESRPGELLISEKKMTALGTAAFRLAERPRPKPRGGRSAWPGCRLKHFRGPGVHTSGVGHDHRLIRASALEAAPMPPVGRLRGEVSHNLNRSLRRVLEQAGQADIDDGQLSGVYLEPCESIESVSRYILFAQDAEPGQTVPEGGRRVSYSRGFFE